MKNKKQIIIIASIIIILLIIIVVFLVIKKDDKKPILKPKAKEIIKEVQIIDEKSKTRPFAIMINNINEARKVQSSLNKAYIVYELVVEGGLTRYLALYKDVPEAVIGSVRSARHYFIDYVLENDAIYVHWGWSPQAQSDIRNLKINNINGLTYEGVYFYRTKNIGAPHNGFTNMELLAKAREKLKYSVETEKENLLKYSAEPVKLNTYESVQDADSVNITYSQNTKIKYEYDQESLKYIRFQDGIKQIDHENNDGVLVKNIIIYQIANYGLNDGMNKGRQDINNVDSGTGYYVSEGKAIKINWSKESRSAQTIYTDEKGERLILNDGNTFIQIVPTTGKAEIIKNETVS